MKKRCAGCGMRDAGSDKRLRSCQLSAISYQPEKRQLSPRPRVSVSPRLSSPASRVPRPAPRTPLPAFSLVEMMIAIMILGLGMVMAATVFPVSLDMTKGTLQMNISQTAADVAAATLAIRVPRLNSELVPTEPRVVLPGMYGRELQWNPRIDNPKNLLANIDVVDDRWGPPNTVTVPSVPNLTNNKIVRDSRLARARLYTGMSFWDAEWSPTQISAYVVAAQNMQVGLNVVAEVPPMPSVGVVTPTGLTPMPPRISIADRVYPPVDRYRIDGTARPLLNAVPTDLGVLDEIASRRYCWTALHYRDLYDLTHSGYYCQIVVFYRSNLDSRYIRQDTITPGIPPQAPQPASTNVDDTLFPQAWLVTVVMNGPAGMVSCTSNVAALLPAGSYIISADLNGVIPPGTSTKIIKNNWDGTATLTPNDPNTWPTWPTLQIKPGEFSSSSVPVSMRAWVFPPAMQSGPPTGTPRTLDDVPNGNLSNVHFEPVSPVIDVVQKKVVAG